MNRIKIIPGDVVIISSTYAIADDNITSRWVVIAPPLQAGYQAVLKSINERYFWTFACRKIS